MSQFASTPPTATGSRRDFCRWLSAFSLGSLLSSGCRSGSSDNVSPSNAEATNDQGGKLLAVCTTGMIAELVREVAGTDFEVVGLLGPVDPHTWEPTMEHTTRLLDADFVFYNGLQLEGKLASVLQKRKLQGKQVIAVAEYVANFKSPLLAESAIPNYLRYPEHDHSHPDPHIWHDVLAWKHCAEVTCVELAARLEESGRTFTGESHRYAAQLTRLQEYAASTLATIPEAARYLVTAHDAFAYFGRAYGLSVEAIQGISTESEPGTNDVNRLVDFLVTKQIPAVFVEETVAPDFLNAVIEGAAAQGWQVQNGGTLYSDSLGAEGSPAANYAGMISHNVDTITRALGGRVPEGGFAGWQPTQAGT